MRCENEISFADEKEIHYVKHFVHSKKHIISIFKRYFSGVFSKNNFDDFELFSHTYNKQTQ